MPALLAILIADDLTGSLDAVAPFAAHGLRSVVATTAEGIAAALAQSADVVSVNLGTREADPTDAGCIAAAATRRLLPHAGKRTIWIKKIDSRMKGPIAAELAAMADVLNPARLLLCPAIPELGRVVRHGHVQGHGLTTPIPLAAHVPPSLPCYDIPDALSDADLDAMCKGLQPHTLLAGARGLAAAVARHCAGTPAAPPARITPGSMGLVIGSRDPVTLAQVAHLRDNAPGGPAFIAAPDGATGTHDTPPASFLLQATPGAGAPGPVVAARLAKAATGLARHVTTLVLSGGETAAAILQSEGIRALQVMGEVLPGLPLSHALDRRGYPAIITKSGGFGQDDTLLRLWQSAQDGNHV